MSKPISKTKEQIWNERLAVTMNEQGLSQRQFITAYKKKFGTGSQGDVSKWMHVGEIDKRAKDKRRFPKFETMQKIADILNVSVGYLIGETDYKTFESERTAKYTGLSAKAVAAIRALTFGKAIHPFYMYPDPLRTSALNNLLISPFLVEYLKGICELASAIDNANNPKPYFKEALNKIPEEYREKAFLLWKDAEEAIENGIVPTQELWDYETTLDAAACKEMNEIDFIAEREIRSAKYALQEIHAKIIDEIISANNIKSLLPQYISQNDLE